MSSLLHCDFNYSKSPHVQQFKIPTINHRERLNPSENMSYTGLSLINAKDQPRHL